MSNFLNRLAGRALGMVPVVRPVIPTQFHPVAEKGRWSDGLVVDEAESPASNDSTLGIRNIHRAHAAKEALRNVVDVSEELSPEEQTELWTERPPIHRLHTQLRDKAAASPAPTSQNFAALPPQPEQDQRRRAIHVRDASPSSRERAIPSDIVDAQRPDSHGSHDQRGALVNHVFAPVPLAVSKRMDPSQSTVVAQHNRPLPPPIVRVTIGRIDVRAEQAPSPAPSVLRRPRAATLSLDQYLKQRSEIRR